MVIIVQIYNPKLGYQRSGNGMVMEEGTINYLNPKNDKENL